MYRPLILISNDDGYEAKGLHVLTELAREYGDVVVVAPDGGRSGAALSVTFQRVLTSRLIKEEPGLKVYACNGTPCDCVKLGLAQYCDRKPDLALGGINHGDNSAVNVHYSGTMGVTLEGCLKYIPSVAFSLCDYRSDADFSPLESYVRTIVQQVLTAGLPKGICLNVNFPLMPEFKGVRVCRMAYGTWGQEVSKCHHPRGYDYWWMMGHYTNDEPEAEDTDNWALTHGYVAVTPTRIDVTAYEAMELIKSWKL